MNGIQARCQEFSGKAQELPALITVGLTCQPHSQLETSSHIGSSIDDFLRGEGILEEPRPIAIKEAVAIQIQQAMETKNITKVEMAPRMKRAVRHWTAFSHPGMLR